jgi:hypothetical protein
VIPSTISLVGTIILILDVFAIFSVLLGRSSSMRKILWFAIILLLPFLGMGLYLLFGRSSEDARAERMQADDWRNRFWVHSGEQGANPLSRFKKDL